LIFFSVTPSLLLIVIVPQVPHEFELDRPFASLFSFALGTTLMLSPGWAAGVFSGGPPESFGCNLGDCPSNHAFSFFFAMGPTPRSTFEAYSVKRSASPPSIQVQDGFFSYPVLFGDPGIIYPFSLLYYRPSALPPMIVMELLPFFPHFGPGRTGQRRDRHHLLPPPG